MKLSKLLREELGNYFKFPIINSFELKTTVYDFIYYIVEENLKSASFNEIKEYKEILINIRNKEGFDNEKFYYKEINKDYGSGFVECYFSIESNNLYIKNDWNGMISNIHFPSDCL